eukprot:gene16422-30483_t
MGRRNQSSVSWTRVVLAAVLLLGTLCIPDARAQRGGGGAVHGQAATAQANEKAAAEEAAKTHADRQAALEAHTAKAKEADDASIEAAAAAAEANAVEANAAEANAAEANVEAAAEMPAQEVAEDPPAAPSDANLDASPGTSARSITSANAALYTEAGEVARWSSSYDANKYYKRIRAAADAGHPDAQLSLAYAQLFGNVTEQVMHDIPAARDTFLALAEQGNPQAQHAAGFLYAMGIGVNSDQAKALVHLTFSALGGDTFAQMALGYRYHVGSGVAASCETALSFYRKAAARVESEVVLTGGEVIERIRLSDEVKRSKAMSQEDIVSYYQHSAERGDAEAQLVVGQLHFQGAHGLAQDFGEAYRYFHRAAHAGDATAMVSLGDMYSSGLGVDQDNETALSYYEKAAKEKNAGAYVGMGLLYKYGQGVKKSEKQAFELFYKD